MSTRHGMDMATARASVYAADSASDAAANATAHKARKLEDRLERLTLLCRAMWELMREKGVATDAEFITKIAVIDASDGVADGKQTSQIRKCIKCDRVIQDIDTKCIYCGAAYVPNSVFETV